MSKSITGWNDLPTEILHQVFSYLDGPDFVAVFNTCFSWRRISAVVVTFSIHYETKYGQNLRIAGDLQSLGSWNPEKSLRLKWEEGAWWSGKLLVPPETTFRYKYNLRNSLTENPAENKWENGPDRSRWFRKGMMGSKIDLVENWKLALQKVHVINNPHGSSDVTCLKSSYGNMLVSLGSDNVIKGWSMQDFTNQFILPCNSTSPIVYNFATSQDSPKLYAFGEKLIQWDITKGAAVQTSSLPITSGGGLLSINEKDNTIVVSCRSGAVMLYDLRSLSHISTYECSRRLITSYTVNNKVIVSTTHSHGVLEIIDFRRSGKEASVWMGDQSPQSGLKGGLALSESCGYVQAIASDPLKNDRMIYLGTGFYHIPPTDTRHSGGGYIRVLDLKRMKLIEMKSANSSGIGGGNIGKPVHKGYGGIFTMAVGNSYLYSGGDIFGDAPSFEDRTREALKVWDSGNLYPVQMLEGVHTEPVGSMEVKGEYLYTGSRDGKIGIWK
eukprot:TRINITY_DN2504_c0_g1_i3.p1 TRINITY_DN2504_c0_g1~~TRINITY_DN2504_c0_g1_i3.p1  ORF type:complete len:497 (-),score=73.16 TRINITY_DN2504_c0_g1_i3:174-1664(-)